MRTARHVFVILSDLFRKIAIIQLGNVTVRNISLVGPVTHARWDSETSQPLVCPARATKSVPNPTSATLTQASASANRASKDSVATPASTFITASRRPDAKVVIVIRGVRSLPLAISQQVNVAVSPFTSDVIVIGVRMVIGTPSMEVALNANATSMVPLRAVAIRKMGNANAKRESEDFVAIIACPIIMALVLRDVERASPATRRATSATRTPAAASVRPSATATTAICAPSTPGATNPTRAARSATARLREA